VITVTALQTSTRGIDPIAESPSRYAVANISVHGSARGSLPHNKISRVRYDEHATGNQPPPYFASMHDNRTSVLQAGTAPTPYNGKSKFWIAIVT
jgi:hypothetical protein